MVDKKISELPEAATLTGLEELPAVQGPDTVRVSIQEIANLASGAPSALIYETVLNAPAGSVTISVPPGHGDLELVAVGRCSDGTDNNLTMRFNGDVGNNYDSVRANVFGQTNHIDQSFISFASMPGPGVAANVVSSIQATIMGYDTSAFHKSCIIYNAYKNSSIIWQYVTGHWESVSPITSITIEAPGTTFVSGTIFRLYGKKAVSYVPTTIAALSDVNFVPAPTNSQVLTYNSTTSKWEPKSKLFEVISSQFGVVESNAILANLMPGVNLSLPENLSGSAAFSEVAATSSTVFSLMKNGTQVATITFSAGQSTGTFSAQAAVSFLPTDKITLMAPATPDATLASVAFRIQFLEV